ncbi:MAG: hypothetical protein IT302_08620 [Dehalococcoidia bacterium]|nr:hypothetical protein [Dehalococcoidia bacterium]
MGFGFLKLASMPAAVLLSAASLAACDEPNRSHRAAILDVGTGQLHRISASDDFAHVMKWSPDSGSVVVVEGNDAVRRKATTGASEWRVKGEPGWFLREAAFSPTGDTVALLHFQEPLEQVGTALDIRSAADGQLAEPGRVWSVLGPVGGHTPILHDLAWASDGRLAAIGVLESRADLFVLDSTSGWAVATEPTVGNEVQVEAAPVGGALAVLGPDGLVLHELGVAARVIRPGPVHGLVDFAFAPDGRRIVMLVNTQLSIYDLDTQQWNPLLDGSANSVSWGADGTIAFSWGGVVHGINADGTHRRVLLEVGGGQSIRSLEWSPDGTKLALILVPRYRD